MYVTIVGFDIFRYMLATDPYFARILNGVQSKHHANFQLQDDFKWLTFVFQIVQGEKIL